MRGIDHKGGVFYLSSCKIEKLIPDNLTLPGMRKTEVLFQHNTNMRKFSLIALFALLAIILFSCNDKELFDSETLLIETYKDFELDNIPIIVNPNNVNLYVSNPIDKDDEKIKKHLLEIAIATRDYLLETPQNKTILASARERAHNCINLYDLISDRLKKATESSEVQSQLIAAIVY